MKSYIQDGSRWLINQFQFVWLYKDVMCYVI